MSTAVDTVLGGTVTPKSELLPTSTVGGLDPDTSSSSSSDDETSASAMADLLDDS